MLVFHVLPMTGYKQTQIKFNQYKYCTKTPFIIYANVQFILEPSGRQMKQTTYTQQHTVCAAAAMFTTSLYNFD